MTGNVTPNLDQDQSGIEQTPQAGVNQPSVQVTPASPKASLFHGIMNVLGGGDKMQYSVDPQMGTLVSNPVPQTTGQLSKSILAGALTGMIAGAGERGPGSVGRSVQAGGAAVMQQRQQADAQKKLEAQQDYERQQKQLVNKAQIFEANSRAALNIQQAEKLGDERMDSYIDYSKPVFDSALNEGRVVQDRVTQQEALEGIKSGKYDPSRDMFVPIARIPRTNPDGTPGKGSELVGAMITDGPFDLNTAGFPKDKAVQYGFLPPAAIAQGASVKASTANQITQKVQTVDNARDEMKLVHDKVGTDAKAMPDFEEAIKTPGMTQALSRFQSYINSAKGFDPVSAINEMTKKKQNPKTGEMVENPDARFVPLVLKAFGGQEVLDKYEKATAKKPTEMSDVQAKTILADPNSTDDQKKMAQKVLDLGVTEAGAKTYASKSAEAKVEEEFQAKQNEILKSPEEFTPIPDAHLLPEKQLRENLQAQGVKIPDNFDALYAIAQGRAKLSTLPQKSYKGRTDITTQNGLSYINKFIKPDYQESDFDAAQMLNKELASSRQGTAGGALLSLGTASQHLDLLKEASEALNNNNLTRLNALANTIGVETGKAAPTVFQAIADRVNEEVTKVTSGGTPHEAELARNRETLGRDQSPQSVDGVIRAYIGLMGGRADEINERSKTYLGKPVRISPTTRALFKRYGMDYDWLEDKKTIQTTQTQSAQPKTTPSPATHTFSISAWQKANPNGDANAAKAAAQKAGYQVIN